MFCTAAEYSRPIQTPIHMFGAVVTELRTREYAKGKNTTDRISLSLYSAICTILLFWPT